MIDMFFHMKTTLTISDAVMRKLKERAARTGKTMSELVESALRESLAKPENTAVKITLPTFHGGKPKVDISNRDMLYDVMEGH